MKTKKLPTTPKRITERQVFANARKLRKGIQEALDRRTKLSRELDTLSIAYFGIKPGDHVEVVSPLAPWKIGRRGVVREVRGFATPGRPEKIGGVLVQPFKAGSKELTYTANARKMFTRRWDLKVVTPDEPAAVPPKPVIARYERTAWINSNTGEVSHGIKAWDSVNRKWWNVCSGDDSLLYNNPAARDAKLKELRAAARAKGGLKP